MRAEQDNLPRSKAACQFVRIRLYFVSPRHACFNSTPPRPHQRTLQWSGPQIAKKGVSPRSTVSSRCPTGGNKSSYILFHLPAAHEASAVSQTRLWLKTPRPRVSVRDPLVQMPRPPAPPNHRTTEKPKHLPTSPTLIPSHLPLHPNSSHATSLPAAVSLTLGSRHFPTFLLSHFHTFPPPTPLQLVTRHKSPVTSQKSLSPTYHVRIAIPCIVVICAKVFSDVPIRNAR